MTKLIHIFGKWLELSGRGAWVYPTVQRHAIYLVLIGQDAEWVVANLPDYNQLVDPAEQDQAGLLPPMVVTDHAGAARLAERKGYTLLHLAAAHLQKRASTHWLVQTLRAQWAVVRPMAVMFNPGVFTLLPRPRNLLTQLLKELCLRGCGQRLHLLLSEASHPLDILLDILKVVDPQQSVKVSCLAAGARNYFDYAEVLKQQQVKVELLALPPQVTADREWNPRRIYLYLSTPLGRRDALAALSTTAERHGWYPAVVFAMGGERIEDDAIYPSVRLNDWAGFEEHLRMRPGIVIADGELPLLPLVGLRSPVVLLRRPNESQMGLVRTSFIMGQGCWPVYETSGEWGRAIAARDLREWWAEYGGRECRLEQSEDCKSFPHAFTRVYRELTRG